MDDKDVTMPELLAYLKEHMATKTDLTTLRAELRVEIRSDVDVLLDQHLQTYMRRYDELARRVKELEAFVGYEPQAS